MTSHRLSPLLNPRSIAYVGASTRTETFGNNAIREIQRAGFSGRVYPINPKYDTVEGLKCYRTIADLPEPVDLAVLSVASRHLEAELVKAIESGARAAMIFASGQLENDHEPPLLERMKAITRTANIPVCGGNCMGFYNYEAKVYASGYQASPKIRQGPVTFISHSGSTLSAVVDSEERLAFNLVISSGQEIATTAAEYMDYALDLPSTRVIALFLETVREPESFIAALEKANRQDVPVVALKVGRTTLSARFAVSHSGAIAGNDAAYQALFDRHGVLRVDTIDEMVATCMLFSQERRASPGGLATIHDSGGERGNLIDLASDARVPFAEIGADTRERLARRLDYGLDPTNPLDAWGTGHDAHAIFRDCFEALLDDPESAMGAFFTDRHMDGRVNHPYGEICRAVAAGTTKPVVMVIHHHGSGSDPFDLELVRSGVPVIDGDVPALKAIRRFFDYRDHRGRAPMKPPPPPGPEVIARWRERLREATRLDEMDSLALLADFGIPTVAAHPIESEEAALAAAEKLGYPVVLKTAAPGIAHKSDQGGVRLGLADAPALRTAHRELRGALGAAMLVEPMVTGGIEMALGVIADPQFGPIVMIGGGGIHIEILSDVRFALPPFDGAAALRLIDGLKLRPVLDGVRGRPRADIEGLAEAAARLSRLAAELGDVIAEIDLNPILVTPEGAIAVDALVVAAPAS